MLLRLPLLQEGAVAVALRSQLQRLPGLLGDSPLEAMAFCDCVKHRNNCKSVSTE